VLLDSGFDAIVVPAHKQTEFNRRMLAFYESGDATPALPFLLSCSLDPQTQLVR